MSRYSNELASPFIGSVALTDRYPPPAAAASTSPNYDLARDVAAVDAELQALIHSVRLTKALKKRGLGSDASSGSSASLLTPSPVDFVDTVVFNNPLTGKTVRGAGPAAQRAPSPAFSAYSSGWDTEDGLVQPELIKYVRIGALDLKDIVPKHPSALSSAGWRQLGDLCIDLATAARDTAHGTELERNVQFAHVARVLQEASTMYATAGALDRAITKYHLRAEWHIVDLDSDSSAGSSSPPMEFQVEAPHQSRWSPDSCDGHREDTPFQYESFLDFDLDCDPETAIHAPVPVQDNIVGQRVVEWLERGAELWPRRSALPSKHFEYSAPAEYELSDLGVCALPPA